MSLCDCWGPPCWRWCINSPSLKVVFNSMDCWVYLLCDWTWNTLRQPGWNWQQVSWHIIQCKLGIDILVTLALCLAYLIWNEMPTGFWAVSVHIHTRWTRKQLRPPLFITYSANFRAEQEHDNVLALVSHILVTWLPSESLTVPTKRQPAPESGFHRKTLFAHGCKGLRHKRCWDSTWKINSFISHCRICIHQ